MKGLDETIREYESYFKERKYQFIERKNFQTPKNSQATFTFCSGMFYEDFYKGSKCVMPNKEAIHQYAIRTDNFYKIGYSPKHLLFFNMLGLFEFNSPDKYENLENILEFLTRTIEPSKLNLKIPQKIRSDKRYLSIINKKNISYRILPNEKLKWITSLKSPYEGLRVEINYQTNNFEIELWNISYIKDKGLLVAIDSGICAERLNLAQNNLSNIYDIEDFKKIRSILINLPRKSKNYFLDSYGSRYDLAYLSSYELNLLADLYRTTYTLIKSGVTPTGKKDRKGMHLRNFLKKQFAFMYINNLDLHSVPRLYESYSPIIEKEVDLFYSNIRLESIDTRLSELKGIMKFSHSSKGNKFFRNKSKKMSLREFKEYRKELYGRVSLDELYKLKDLAPFEILLDWAISNDILEICDNRDLSQENVKKLCDKYKTNLLILKRGELL